MKLFLLQLIEKFTDYDQMNACVIIAETELDARVLAATGSSKNNHHWHHSAASTCVEIGTANTDEAGIVLADYANA